MGYFDAVKQQRKLHAVPPQPPEDAPVRAPREGLHPYAAKVVEAELARLDAARSAPLGQPPHWDLTTFEVACNLIEIANSPWSGYGITTAHSDFDTRAPRDARFDQRQVDSKWTSAEKRIGAAGRPEPAPSTLELPATTVLASPDLTAAEDVDFWDARHYLEHIRTYARARRVSPWAVLGVVLARVATATPHFVVLPPIVGGVASLNLFVGLVGRSGAGKGAAESVAAECFNVGLIETHTTGSGEGIAHGYMHRTKNGPEWNDELHAVLFSVPEIDTLSALGNRQGATLMPELRRAWSGERLGFAYADPTKRLPVPAHEYRMCLVAGIQPGRAQTLLEDSDGGTPQRFLWLPAYDPDAPTVPPECPEPMKWEAPDTGSRSTSGQFVTRTGEIRIRVAQVARDTIDQARLDRLRGSGEALDGHGLLTRLKVAAALGLADGRLEVTEEDWHLAGVIHRKSDATRAGVQQVLTAANEERNTARATSEAKRALIVNEQVDEARVKAVSRSIVRQLRKSGDWTPSSALRRTLRSDLRAWFEDAVGRLVETGEIEGEEASQGHRYRLTERDSK